MFDKFRRRVERYNQVLAEGAYRAQPMTFMNLLRGMKPDLHLPATSEVAVGTQMIDTGKSFGSKFLWGSALALSGAMHFLMLAAIGMGAAGITVYALEYRHAKRAREDVLTEINFAGQRVQGRRADLFRLHRAQLRVMNISASLESGNAATASAAIKDILDGVKAERERVKVLDGGRYGAGKEAYAFSEPGFHLLPEATGAAPKPVELAAAPAAVPEPGALKEAFARAKLTPDEIAERLVSLEQSLPQEIADKLAERRNAAKPAAAELSTAAPKP